MERTPPHLPQKSSGDDAGDEHDDSEGEQEDGGVEEAVGGGFERAGRRQHGSQTPQAGQQHPPHATLEGVHLVRVHIRRQRRVLDGHVQQEEEGRIG